MVNWIKKQIKIKRILGQLDSCAKDFTFPMLDNGYIYLIDSKMTLLSSKDYWAITIEVIGFSPRGGGHGGINNAVHIYGDFPGCTPGLENKNFYYFTEDVNGDKAFDEEYGFYLNPKAKRILINGIEYSLVHDREKYSEANVPTEDDEFIGIQEYLRLIWPEVDEKPFLRLDELLNITHEELTKSAQLENWWHPDLAKGELPSETETFIKIAHAFAHDDFEELSRLSLVTNTSWKNWPTGGTL